MSYQPRRMRNDENPYRKSTKGSSNMGYSSNKNYTKSNKSSKPAKNKSGKGVVVFRILTLAYIIITIVLLQKLSLLCLLQLV